jgi:hypothetical protein
MFDPKLSSSAIPAHKTDAQNIIPKIWWNYLHPRKLYEPPVVLEHRRQSTVIRPHLDIRASSRPNHPMVIFHPGRVHTIQMSIID